MREYRIYQVDSFTDEKLHGNPAGVVSNADGLTDLLFKYRIKRRSI